MPVYIYVPIYTHLFDSPTRRSTNLLCPDSRTLLALAFSSLCAPKLLLSSGQGELLLAFFAFKTQMERRLMYLVLHKHAVDFMR